ncbi:MAG: hypothetical protein KQJ78_24005 [Deltaproteobacteria bacterium]|nr:hypothetical protein [Deltaproteobacteria bacterium]
MPRNDLNPQGPLRAILADSPATPTQRIQAVTLLLFGWSQARLAGHLGITPGRLSMAIHSRDNEGRNTRARVAAALGLAVGDLWPERAGEAQDEAA